MKITSLNKEKKLETCKKFFTKKAYTFLQHQNFLII